MKALLWAWGRPGASGQSSSWLFSRQAWGNPSLGTCAHPEPRFLPLEPGARLTGYFKDSVRSVCKVLSAGESTRHTGAVLILVITDMLFLFLGPRKGKPALKPSLLESAWARRHGRPEGGAPGPDLVQELGCRTF